MKYFGDSYDVVKQSFLRWLKGFGAWSTHPMFTEAVSDDELSAFEQMLGAKVICSDVLGVDTDRRRYLESTKLAGNLFLDPNTGLALRKSAPKGSPEYLFVGELIEIVNARSSSLTLVFDQSLARGNERAGLRPKLSHLLENSIPCFAYCSHAAFIVASKEATLVEYAYRAVLTLSNLPPTRFIQAEPKSQAAGA